MIPLQRPFQRCIIRPDTLRGFHVRAGKQKRGKFRFSSPRARMETGVPPLWSPELTGFFGIGTTRFGVLLKFKVSAPLVPTLNFVCPNECWMRGGNFGMLLTPKLDSVGGSYSGQLSCLQWSRSTESACWGSCWLWGDRPEFVVLWEWRPPERVESDMGSPHKESSRQTFATVDFFWMGKKNCKVQTKIYSPTTVNISAMPEDETYHHSSSPFPMDPLPDHSPIGPRVSGIISMAQTLSVRSTSSIIVVPFGNWITIELNPVALSCLLNGTWLCCF